MMRTKVWASVTAAVFLFGGAYGISEAKSASSAAGQSKNLIGVSKAQEYALKAAEGRVESIDLEQKATGTYYEVDIQQSKQEVDVRVDAYTGKILSVRKETDDDDDDNDAVAVAAQSGSPITAAEAAEAANAAVKGTVKEIDLDRDNGSLIYEVEIKNGSVSTEVGIDAYTSKVLYTDVDSDDDED